MKFTLYTSQTCAYCEQLKKFLGMKSAEYETVDIANDLETRQELQRKYSAVTVPVLVREDGEYMVGFNLSKAASMVQ